MKDNSYKRHLLKTITWRIVGTLDTILLSWLITGDVLLGLQIGLAETLTKLILYFLHERVWYKINLVKNAKVLDSRKRHLAKTITWRTIGTLDTIILAWIITGSPLSGLKIGFAEVLTKMLLYYLHERVWYKLDYGLIKRKKKHMKNIVQQHFSLSREKRGHLKKHNPLLIWFTGLSGSGKSTLANAVEEALYAMNIHTYTLDGDNVRSGLNKNLTFTAEDRTENIRRIAEVSKLMMDAGLVVLGSFVSPYQKDRDNIAKTVGKDYYVEIFVNTPIEECEKRDVKGLYKKARSGEITHFTGIDTTYEIPLHPTIIINTMDTSVQKAVDQILNYIKPKLALSNG